MWDSVMRAERTNASREPLRHPASAEEHQVVAVDNHEIARS